MGWDTLPWVLPGHEAAAVRALGGELLERLPRYEAHLSRELDRSLSRYRQLQQDRRRAVELEQL